MKFEVFWKNEGYKARPELKQDIACDYLIIGGGITGLSAAYFLAKKGVTNIVVAEKNTIGSGATGKSAGTLIMRAERDLKDLIQEYGIEKTEVLWGKTHEALQHLKRIIDEADIDCDAEIQDTLMCGFKKKTANDVYAEYEAEKSLELTTKMLEGDDLKKEVNSPLFSHGMLSAQHGLCVNPLKFIQGFSHAVEKLGVTIYENTSVTRASDGNAKTAQGDIHYKKLIWAIDADYPEDDIKNLKTTVVVTRPLSHDEVSRIGFAKRKKVVWDSRRNENYFKMTEDNRILMGFGGIVVHKRNKKTDPHFPHLQQLEGFLKKLFPYLDLPVEYAWSGHFGVNKHWSQGPFIEIKGDTAAIGGCGSQVICFMAAEHVADTLLGKESPVKDFFLGKPSPVV